MAKDKKTAEGLNEFLVSSNLAFLNSASQIPEEEVIEEFITKGDYVGCLEHFHNRHQTSLPEPLLKHLFRTISKAIYAKCFENHKEVNESAVKAMVVECSKLLRGLLDDKPEAQLLLLGTLSEFWEKSSFELRDDYLRLLFAYFYDEAVMPEDAYFKWKERYERKSAAFLVVRKWIDWLQNAEEEEEEEEEEANDDDDDGMADDDDGQGEDYNDETR